MLGIKRVREWLSEQLIWQIFRATNTGERREEENQGERARRIFFFKMKFAVVSVQTNEKTVGLFLISLRSCGFLYTNMHAVEQKTDFFLYHSTPRTSFQLQILFFFFFLLFHPFSHQFSSCANFKLDPGQNKKVEPALFSGIPGWCQ